MNLHRTLTGPHTPHYHMLPLLSLPFPTVPAPTQLYISPVSSHLPTLQERQPSVDVRLCMERQEPCPAIHALLQPNPHWTSKSISFCKESFVHTQRIEKRGRRRKRKRRWWQHHHQNTGKRCLPHTTNTHPTHNQHTTNQLQALLTRPHFITRTYFDAFSRVIPLRKRPDQIRDRHDISNGRTVLENKHA